VDEFSKQQRAEAAFREFLNRDAADAPTGPVTMLDLKRRQRASRGRLVAAVAIAVTLVAGAAAITVPNLAPRQDALGVPSDAGWTPIAAVPAGFTGWDVWIDGVGYAMFADGEASYSYDAASDTWTALPAAAETAGGRGVQVAADESKVYVLFDGADEDASPVIQAYDIASAAWESVPARVKGGAKLPATGTFESTTDGLVYSGWDDNSGIDTIYYWYNVRTSAWEPRKVGDYALWDPYGPQANYPILAAGISADGGEDLIAVTPSTGEVARLGTIDAECHDSPAVTLSGHAIFNGEKFCDLDLATGLWRKLPSVTEFLASEDLPPSDAAWVKAYYPADAGDYANLGVDSEYLYAATESKWYAVRIPDLPADVTDPEWEAASGFLAVCELDDQTVCYQRDMGPLKDWLEPIES
jgi:hypothetical protein